MGHCTDCKAKIQCEATPKDLQFSIENFDPNYKHDPKKKRRVLSVDMPKLHEKLQAKSVLKLRAEMAAELMLFGEPEPSIIPSADAMRKAKSRIDCPETDPFTALSFLQKKYPKTIHSIGYDPFFIIFSTPLQRAVYKGEAMRNKRPTISIDATGLGNLLNDGCEDAEYFIFEFSLILNISFSGLRKPLKNQFTDTYILFYSIVCHGAQKSFTVGQMLSQIHNMEWLIHWMHTWKPQKKELWPLEIVMDESSALIGAAVAVFTQDKTIFQYLDRCVNVLLGKNVDLPKCYIHIDRSHFVKSIHRNLRKGEPKTVKLLRGVLGYLISCSDREEFGRIMENIFTLVCNEFISPEVMAARDMLIQLVRTHEAVTDKIFNEIVGDDLPGEDLRDDAENIHDEFAVEITSHKGTSSFLWVMRFHDSVQVAGDDMPRNIHFCTRRIVNYLIHSFVRSSLWSNLMMNEFESDKEYATSTPVENEFKNIKKLLDFKSHRPDVFVKKYLEHLDGQMKLKKAMHISSEPHYFQNRRHSFDASEPVKSEMRRSTSLEEFSAESFDLSTEDSLQIMENWRNKVKKSSHMLKNIHTRRAANSILVKHDPEYSRTNIKLLENGYEGPNMSTVHTCAFDSIYPIMCVAYLDYDIKQQFASNDSFCNFVRDIVQAPKSLTRLYNSRNQILYDIFSSKAYEIAGNVTKTGIGGTKKKGIKVYIDCFTVIGGFYSQLRLASYIEFGKCECGQVRSGRFPLIPLKVNSRRPVDLMNIQDIVIHHSKKRACGACQRSVNVSIMLENILAFEVEPPENHENISTIGDIQDMILVLNKSFKLFGVIEFIPAIRHFVAFVKRKNDLWEKYDDMQHKKIPRIDKLTLQIRM